MIQTYPIENKDEIEQMLKQHRFSGTQFRINVVENPETTRLKTEGLHLSIASSQTLKRMEHCSTQ